MEVLVLYYSRNGSVKEMAQMVARGVESVTGVQARLRTVPPVSPLSEATSASIPDSGDPYVDHTDLRECAGLALGSPARFGSIAAPLKYFLETTASMWMAGELVGKPAAVFTSSSSAHGGQESTLLSMMVPLLHHGMVLMGLPYTQSALFRTRTGGTPYGASHVAGASNDLPLSAEEKELCLALGQRLAAYSKALAGSEVA